MTDAEIKKLAGELAYETSATPERAEVFVRLAAAAGCSAETIGWIVSAFRGDYELATIYVSQLRELERQLIHGSETIDFEPRGILNYGEEAEARKRFEGRYSPEKVGEIFGLPVYVDPTLPPNTATFGPPAAPAYGIVNRAARRRRG